MANMSLERDAEVLIDRVGRRVGVEEGILTLVYAMRHVGEGGSRYWTLWRKVAELVDRLEAEHGPPPALGG